eukprot:412679_1
MVPELRIWGEHHEEKHLVSDRVSGISQVFGSLFTLSFQVDRADEVRCYVWWDGKCVRLHTEDFWNVLPYLFIQEDPEKWKWAKKNKQFVNDEKMKQRIR